MLLNQKQLRELANYDSKQWHSDKRWRQRVAIKVGNPKHLDNFQDTSEDNPNELLLHKTKSRYELWREQTIK